MVGEWWMTVWGQLNYLWFGLHERKAGRPSTTSSSQSQHKSSRVTFYNNKHLKVSRMTKPQQPVEDQMNPGITVALGSTLHLVTKETTPKVRALVRMIGDHRFNENKMLDNNRDAKKSCTLLCRLSLQVKRCLQPSSRSLQHIWNQLFHGLAVIHPGKAL